MRSPGVVAMAHRYPARGPLGPGPEAIPASFRLRSLRVAGGRWHAEGDWRRGLDAKAAPECCPSPDICRGRASGPGDTRPSRNYALLADGYRGVLVGPQGDCAWMCFPRWSDPAVFASLVGSGGHYLVEPPGRWVWGGYYEDGSLIWVSRWVTENGTFESRKR